MKVSYLNKNLRNSFKYMRFFRINRVTLFNFINTNVKRSNARKIINKINGFNFSEQILEEKNEIIPEELLKFKINNTIEINSLINIMSLSNMLNVNYDQLLDDYNNVLKTKINDIFEYLSYEDLELYLIEKEIPYNINLEKNEYFTRGPIVTIMGHVDHGKTTLLDYWRKSNIVSMEYGAITQAIGAFNIYFNDKSITVIDTPGHQSFAKMRLKGAKTTDLILLIISSVEGIKTQTLEVLDIIKSSKLPCIIVLNKIDLPNADPKDVISQLFTDHGIIASEDFEEYKILKEKKKALVYPCVKISAKTGRGIDVLNDCILKLVEFDKLNTKEELNVPAQAYVIESKSDKTNKFGLANASVIVKKGVLKEGDYFICGTLHGKIKLMKNDNGKDIKEAYPGQAIEIIGFKTIPQTGSLLSITDQKIAIQIAEERIKKNELKDLKRLENINKAVKFTFAKRSRERKRMMKSNNRTLWEEKINTLIEENEIEQDDIQSIRETYLLKDDKTKQCIVKTDSEGVIEALMFELTKVFSPNIIEMFIKDISVGNVSSEEIQHAKDSDSIIFCFNDNDEDKILGYCNLLEVGCRSHKLIFQLVNELIAFIQESAINGYFDSKLDFLNDIIIGRAVVNEVFNIKINNKVHRIAGLTVSEGIISDTCFIRVQNKKEIKKGFNKIFSLKQVNQPVSLVKVGADCGLILEDFDEFEPGDNIIAYNLDKEFIGITKTNSYKKCYNN